MEIGQFIEVSFSQPLISNSTKTPVEIEVKLGKDDQQDKDCTLFIDGSSVIHDWNNTVFVNFQHESSSSTFEFQIGKNILNGNEEINCYYEINRVYYCATYNKKNKTRLEVGLIKEQGRYNYWKINN